MIAISLYIVVYFIKVSRSFHTHTHTHTLYYSKRITNVYIFSIKAYKFSGKLIGSQIASYQSETLLRSLQTHTSSMGQITKRKGL